MSLTIKEWKRDLIKILVGASIGGMLVSLASGFLLARQLMIIDYGNYGIIIRGDYGYPIPWRLGLYGSQVSLPNFVINSVFWMILSFLALHFGVFVWKMLNTNRSRM